jgi:hypothetical protein
MIEEIDGNIEPWTERIVRGDASLSDVPDDNITHIAYEVKTYANQFPDIGVSMTVNRLTDELNAVEVTLNE